MMAEMKSESRRRRLEIRKTQLEAELQSFKPQFRELADYILPRRLRLSTGDVNRADRRNNKIIDSTATMSVRTLRSGMMAGVTSPARPWFRFGISDPSLAEMSEVKRFLHESAERMQTVFLSTNLYQALPIVYGDIGVFATGAMLIEEDMESVFRCYPLPVGSYSIGMNEKLKVDTFSRDFTMTVRQIVDKFGERDEETGKVNWQNISVTVKTMYEQGNLENRINVTHMILPNDLHDKKKLGSKHKKYASVYFEAGGASGNDQDILLSEKGYDIFPILCPRWEVTGEDSWGNECPGMVTLGDIKQLQLMEKRAAQAIEKKVNPPMVGPTSMKNTRQSILPGDVSYVDETNDKRFRPAHEVNISIVELENKMDQIRRRIQRGFFEDLFLMLANDQRSNITAREIDERHEEKLLALGPVLEQLNQDLLDPLIDLVFDIMLRQRLLPEIPEALSGMPLKIQYISIMAQAQKMVGKAGADAYLVMRERMAAVNPATSAKFNDDQFIDIYSEMISIPPSVVRSDDEANEIRGQQAQAQKAQETANQAQQMAGAAKNLSQTDLGKGSAFDRIADMAQAGDLSGVTGE